MLFNIIILSAQLVSSGAMVPRELLSGFFHVLSLYLPATYAVQGNMNLLFGGPSVAGPSWALIIIMLASVAAGVVITAELFNTFFPGKSQLEERSDEWSEPLEGLKTLIQEVIRYRMSEPEMILLLQQEILKNTHRIDHIRKYSFPVWQVLRELLERGKTQGVFRYRSLDNTMFFIMGTILFHKHTEYFKPLLAEAPPSLEELVEDTLQFILQGLGVAAAD